MRDKILEELRKIEMREGVKILLAVESGSRAWGFASPDSDYDVRFIYVREANDYLRLDSPRNVIELPIDNELDINGWDLQKALKLLYKSNPTLFEWFSSPIVYMETEFADKFRTVMNEYFSNVRSLYHYISMAEGNFRDYLRGDMVKAKKYFYVLRPVLAAKWILDKSVPAPMLFSELAEEMLPEELKGEVNRLLEIKMDSPEIKEVPRVDSINEYLESSIFELKERLRYEKETKFSEWGRLNDLFLEALGEYEWRQKR